MFLTIVPQLDKCLKFMTFRGIVLHRAQSFLSLRIEVNFKYLFSCDTIDAKICLPQFSSFSKLYEQTASVVGVRAQIVAKSPRVKGALTNI